MRYILFIKKECPFCVKAIQFLEEKKIEYSLVNFNHEQESILQEVKNAYNWKTVPMIFSRDNDLVKLIGGYTDLIKLFGE